MKSVNSEQHSGSIPTKRGFIEDKKRKESNLYYYQILTCKKVKIKQEMNFLGSGYMSYTQLLMAADQEVLKVPLYC